MLDPYGNKVAVGYSITDSNEDWSVSDSTGRRHTIRFNLSDSARAGGDAGSDWETQDGDEWGDLRRIVDFVDVAAFGGTIARYDFSYATHTIGRSCPHDDEFFPANANAIRTRVLTSITVPESQPYSFQTNTSGSNACGGDQRGRVTRVTLV